MAIFDSFISRKHTGYIEMGSNLGVGAKYAGYKNIQLRPVEM